ncbi:hypothetical protein Tco_1203597, partial [Tanacetum coccineum]
MLGITLEYLRMDVYRSVWVVEKNAMDLVWCLLLAMHVWCKTWSKRQSKVQVMGLGL